VINSANPLVLQQAVALMIMEAQMVSYHMIFIWGGVILLAGAALALAIKIKETKSGKEVFVE
jgi:hypothetical protein